MNKINKAIKFAAEKHKGQIRKYSGEPYILHLTGVYNLLRQSTDDQDVWIAGILHDVIEDTDTEYEEVKEKFGKKVADIVQECTKDKKKNFKLTMKESLLIKCADVLNNLGSNNDEWYAKKLLNRWQPHTTPKEFMHNPRFEDK
ncbi:MAG: HD domain-containing protein [Nanoarchaeota archaeon]|nr:HD domain-containing protein [Nanoarchaeota archaeon]